MTHFYLALFSCKKYKKTQASKNHMYSTLIYTHLEKKNIIAMFQTCFPTSEKSRTINWKISYLKSNWKDLATNQKYPAAQQRRWCYGFVQLF